MILPPTSYQELARRCQEGLDYRICLAQRPSKTVILAPHGGGIEPGTSEIARALAGDHFSFYCLEGLRATGNWELHLTSLDFDELSCQGLLSQSQWAVAVHGCRGNTPLVHVGGLDALLKHRVIRALCQAGFQAVADTTHHAGAHPHSLCNRALSGQGVQLEISLGLRRLFFPGLRAQERQRTTVVFWDFVFPIRQALLRLG